MSQTRDDEPSQDLITDVVITFGNIPNCGEESTVVSDTSEIDKKPNVICFGDFCFEFDSSEHPSIPRNILESLLEYLPMSSLLDDLLKLFKLKESEPLYIRLKDRENAMYEELRVMHGELLVAIQGSSYFNNLLNTRETIRDQMFDIRAEIRDLDPHCPSWLARVKVEAAEISMSRIINDFFEKSEILRSAEIELNRLIETVLRKITEGGYFQDKRFTIDKRYISDGGVPDVVKIMKWFKEFPDYLEEWKLGYLNEFGDENPMPTREGFDWQILSFPWYRERDEIPTYGNQLFRLHDFVTALKQVLARTIGNLYQHIKDIYFSSIDIQMIASEIYEVKSRPDKEILLRSLYANKVMCPSDMHKICLSLIVDPSGWCRRVLIDSI